MGNVHPAIASLHPDARLVATTPTDANVFFGFHDITPWSPDGEKLLCLRLDPEWQTLADSGGVADICVWEPAKGRLGRVGKTSCWNFQQAARQQWLIDGSDRFTFNSCDASGSCIATVANNDGSEGGSFEGGLYALCPDGVSAISPDFDVLADRWPAYGYRILRGSSASKTADQVGLWRTDLYSGERKLLISLATVLAGWQGTDSADGHFLTHPVFSPDGNRLVFLHRFFAADGGSYTRMLCCQSDGSNLRVLADEKVSHFDWVDSNTLLAWARFTGGGLAQARASGALNAPLIRPLLNLVRKFSGRWKKRMLAEAYYSLAADGSGARQKIGWPALDQDGHPMVARAHDWVVTDTYPDASGFLTLILWNRHTGQRIDVACFKDGVTTDDSDAKCDLHPRWNRDETQIAVDYCVGGLRGIAVIDVSDLVGAKT